MKRYIAFLRGINLNGKNKVAMAHLKKAFCDLGFQEVDTILNSGNVFFSSGCEDRKQIVNWVTEGLRDVFGFQIPVCIMEQEHLKHILDCAPAWWNAEAKSRYHNLVFILTDETPEEICRLIGEPSEGKEQVQAFEDVIFWSFDLGCYQKCRWWKRTATKGIAEKLTIRTGNTVKKICKSWS